MFTSVRFSYQWSPWLEPHRCPIAMAPLRGIGTCMCRVRRGWRSQDFATADAGRRRVKDFQFRQRNAVGNTWGFRLSEIHKTFTMRIAPGTSQLERSCIGFIRCLEEQASLPPDGISGLPPDGALRADLVRAFGFAASRASEPPIAPKMRRGDLMGFSYVSSHRGPYSMFHLKRKAAGR